MVLKRCSGHCAMGVSTLYSIRGCRKRDERQLKGRRRNKQQEKQHSRTTRLRSSDKIELLDIRLMCTTNVARLYVHTTPDVAPRVGLVRDSNPFDDFLFPSPVITLHNVNVGIVLIPM
jgi:hypothetical protein